MIYAVMTPGPAGRRYLELCRKSWLPVQRQLLSEQLIGTGCDPRDPFAPRRAVPADRWQYAQINFEQWTARIGDVDIIEIEVSSVGLKIYSTLELVNWGGVQFRLSFRLFPAFYVLAKGAKENRAVNTTDLMTIGRFPDESTVSLAIFRIKKRMQRYGFDKATCDALISSVPRGYRLNIPPAEISFED